MWRLRTTWGMDILSTRLDIYFTGSVLVVIFHACLWVASLVAALTYFHLI